MVVIVRPYILAIVFILKFIQNLLSIISFNLFIYLFNSDPRSITEKKKTKKQNKIKQQKLHRMIQIPKI